MCVHIVYEYGSICLCICVSGYVSVCVSVCLHADVMRVSVKGRLLSGNPGSLKPQWESNNKGQQQLLLQRAI